MLFADDTSLFSAVHDANTSANNLNNDLSKKLMTGQQNGKSVLILIQVNKFKKLYFPENIRI